MSARVRALVVVLVTVLSVASCKGQPAATPPAGDSPAATKAPAPSRVPLPTVSIEAASTGEAAAAASAQVSAAAASAVVVLEQPAKSSGGLIPSSWRQPEGGSNDRSVWDNFMFETAHTITEFRWRGGYDDTKGGSGGPVLNFTIDIYRAISTGSEPDLAIAPLVHYAVGNNAGEQPSEMVAGKKTYEYHYTLPAPFEAAALTAYWVQIVAFQAGEPDWGLAVGSLGDGRHFRLSGAPGEGYYHQLVPEDTTLELLASGSTAPTPAADVARSLEEIAEQLANLPPAEEVAVNGEGVQEVMLVVSRSGYTPVHFSVKVGVPVRLTFRQLGYVPGGNELNVDWGPNEGTYVMLATISDKKVLEFTPTVTGDYRYSCPHEWYWGVMTVRE